ncbi:MAG: c-type cytochrome [Planctomycetota bacterium]
MDSIFSVAHVRFTLLGLCCAAMAVAFVGCSEETVITTCDGSGKVTVASDAKGQDLADALMAQWKRDHPESDWVAREKEAHELKPPADNSALLEGGQADGHVYGQHDKRDLILWARETEKFVVEGSRIFHSGDLLQSTVAVSCDMCHPHASNTHPETYPKYQTQLGRVALLRDMINWCIENPVRGKRLEPDDPAMRAIEAYIMAQRTGTLMNYGKH